MAEVPSKLAELLEMFDLIDDRAERIQVLIDTAERFREVPERIASRPFSEEHKVPACESQAYAWVEHLDGDGWKLYFAVENPQGISAKAMAVILDETLSGSTAEEIESVPGDLPYRIFGNELSMGKNMGLTGMVQMVKSLARECR